MSTVLCIDGGASQTREIVLTQNGYTVLAATDIYRAAEIFRSSTIDAVVLDTGASFSTISALAYALKLTQPQVPVLLVADAPQAEDEPPPPCDVIMCRLDGPAALLTHLQNLIAGTRQSSDRGAQAAIAAVHTSRQLRGRLAELRARLHRTRQLSRDLRDRHRKSGPR